MVSTALKFPHHVSCSRFVKTTAFLKLYFLHVDEYHVTIQVVRAILSCREAL